MKSIKQQVGDALWYLMKDGFNPMDEKKAIEILSSIAFGPEAEKKLEELKKSTQTSGVFQFSELKEIFGGVEIAIIIGHEPGGGAQGERVYNRKVAGWMVDRLELVGAKVFLYEHKTKRYSTRQKEMRAAVKKAQPNNLVCVELHYDGYFKKSANGHHFQYLGAPMLARSIANRFQSRFPQSTPRHEKGTLKNVKGNGAGFLKMAPGWAVLCEPYFITNPAEAEFFKDKWKDIAMCNVLGLADFIQYLKTK